MDRSRPHRARMRTRRRLAASAVAAVMTILLPASALADSLTVTFESPTYSPGTVNGQDGWSSTGPYDQEVVTNTYGYTTFDGQSLRISNAVTSGSFGDQTFSKPLQEEAGETNAYSPAPTTQRRPYFTTQWDFASTVQSEQQGLSIVASPDRGDGGRMSWVQMRDTAAGLEVNFYDYQDRAPYGTSANPSDGVSDEDDFVFTNVASGLDRSLPHSLRLEMFLVDGPRNDVVNVYVDGVLAHTGTSWEDYFRWYQGPDDPEETAPVRESRTVRTVLFRAGGNAAPATDDKGFLIDNLTLSSSTFPVPSLAPCAGVIDPPTTYRLVADCTTDRTLLVPDGWTLDGDGYTITAVDPAGGHFLGAVVRNGGATAYVRDLTVTASGLDDVCDAGNDRLRGILFDGAGGSITDTTVTGVRQGPSGCQEGNAIEVRNEPFDTSGTDVSVTISGNSVSDYQKNGITVNGSVAATITDNTVTGDGPVTYIAQNGIQVGYGARALLRDNAVSGNNYTPKAWVACGLLLFDADGVRASSNTYLGNERDVCNFGKGGGKFTPAS